jgi:guanylate kinase
MSPLHAASGEAPTIKRRGLMLVLSSPSGAGKTTIARRLLEADTGITLSVSVTTRPKRPSEIDGVHYHFIDRRTYDRMVEEEALLEHAEVYGHGYGTPKAAVEKALAEGMDVLFDIDWQGAQQLRQQVHEDIVSMFILPPSTAELAKRLRKRAEDSDEVVAKRLAQVAADVTHWAEYGYVMVNVDLEQSIAAARSVLTAERLKRRRQIGLADFVGQFREHPERAS